mgnify:CR=1 FL=1
MQLLLQLYAGLTRLDEEGEALAAGLYELAERVQAVALEAHPWQDVPLERVIEALLPVRDPSRIEDSALYFGPVMDGAALPRHPFWPDAPPQSAVTLMDQEFKVPTSAA